MRFNPIPLITVLLLLGFSSLAQDGSRYTIQLRSGPVTPEKNISAQRLEQFNRTAAKTSGKSFAIIQFEQIPTEEEKQQLKSSGIELLDYIPGNAYTVTITGSLNEAALIATKARAVIEPGAMQKMQPELATGNFPSWAVKTPGTVDVWVSFPRTFSYETVQKEMLQRNFEIIGTDHKNYRIIALRVTLLRLGELALLPCIEYVQVIPGEDKALNYNSMFLSKAHVLKASLAVGGQNLNGQGVVVGIGDDGDMQTHLDFTNRLINRSGETPHAHASHVAGTVGGAGIIQELYAGYAPKAKIIGQVFSHVFLNAPAYVQDHGMVITNNSYGSVVHECAYNGLYDLTARILDQQAFDLPELQNVFAAGNDGLLNCGPYPATFKSVLGGYQAAKNVITVGSTTLRGDVSAFSSRGPVRDGRVKPEIMAQGEFLASTWYFNAYSYNNGTSMAAPGVSGGLVLLVQGYRNLHGGLNPKNGLLKALLINGGLDKNNAGPSFTYGFGNMNLLRSYKMMENNTYFTSTITQGSTQSQMINVPANTARLKILLYWQDPPASVMAGQTLVNDLDLEVIAPVGPNPKLPLILNAAPGSVANPAAPGADHTNNIEQVVINDPPAGNYDLNVIGTLIAQNPSQEYHLVYDIIPEDLVLTNPVGGESFVPTISPIFIDTVYLSWDSYGDPANPFTLEFFNGLSWSTLSSTVPGGDRTYGWAVPINNPTDAARIRISKNGTLLTKTSFPFVITDMPVVSLDPAQCEGYIRLNWLAVNGATDYEVMMLQGDEMVSVAIVSAATLSYTFSGLSKDSVYWVTVRPRINGNPGRRADAISRQPNTGTCAGTISDNDLKIDAILSPASSGRLFTNSELTSSTDVTIRIRNLDDALSTADINVSYSVNGGPPVNATITGLPAEIAAGGTIDYNFATDVNLLAAGTYSIEVTATKASDPVIANNRMTKIFKQLDNQLISNGDLPWIDNMESAAAQTVTTSQMGLTGRDRYDFVNSTVYGQLRTFINTGIAYSGSKALTADMSLYAPAGNVDSLTATFNLNSFTAADEIRLDFRYKNHGQKSNAANKVWIRGNETNSWIEMYDLFANQNDADGTYKLSSSLELNDSLAAHGQSFSRSFQVRWGQWGQYMTADNESGAGYSFDDIRLYRAVDDIQMVSIDTPVTIACNLSNAVPVKVTVRNTSNAIINSVPIFLRVDGSLVASEFVPSVPANDTVHYLFNPGTANLSVPGNHTIEVWVDYLTDNVPDNDTTTIIAKSLPYINTFPYLEDFESGDGNWYTVSDTSSTWQYGSPVSAKINRAASGTKAWKTHIAGFYNDKEFSYLYSPCFNVSGMTNPTLSFSFSLDIEDCGAGVLCDAGWMEYSSDGITWSKLGAVGQGTNWYNRNYAGNHVWSQQDYTRWHVATIALPATNNSNLRLRFVFKSDEASTKDGMGVDDIHIYDNIYGIYTGSGPSPVVNQPIVNGSSWIHFLEPAGNGQLIASINPNGQNLGSTNAQAFIYPGAVRNNSGQYYHNRNITIKPTTVNLPGPDSAIVRFYFLDSETELLINAAGCGSCYKPTMAYELGVSKYSDPDDFFEDGIVENSLVTGGWSFINTSKRKMVPFDKGYYAEFKVKDFSEFWLNNGGFDNNHPLPAQLLNFTARKKNDKDVLTEWVTASEFNVNRFEIEVAKGNIAYQQNQFVKIGEVASQGNSTREQHYSFTDEELNKTGARYYRLKLIDNDNSSKYSAIRPVVFDASINWEVSPNPSAGLFTLSLQANRGEPILIKVYNVAGKITREYKIQGDGFVQKQAIDLRDARYATGLYLLEAISGEQKQIFRIIKQ
ncbi:MAG TPA: S8 family serine peptidase [Chitinophagaceae bacterium]|jgi:hypothetical protein|nr:S8 family serine peptidase [Chitinophagaceae bacterium]